jgi:hypothetical protein
MAWWKSLPTNVRKFMRLHAQERLTLFQACVLVPVTALAFACLGFRRWHATLERWTARGEAAWTGGDEEAAARAHRVARLIRVAAQYVAGDNSCLRQALVLWWLLRRQGLQTELRIGVRKEGDQLKAHAWVECQGLVLDDRGNESLPFVSFDRAIVPYESVSA